MQFYLSVPTNVIIDVGSVFLKCLKSSVRSPNEVERFGSLYFMVFLVCLFGISLLLCGFPNQNTFALQAVIHTPLV